MDDDTNTFFRGVIDNVASELDIIKNKRIQLINDGSAEGLILDEEAEEEGDLPVPAKEYDYLLSMPLWSLSYEKVNDLLKSKEMKIGDYIWKKKEMAQVAFVSFLSCGLHFHILYDSLLLKRIFLPPPNFNDVKLHRASRYMTKTFFFSFVLNFLFCVFLRTVRVENHLGTTCQTFCSSRQFSPLGADKRIDAQENVYRAQFIVIFFSDWGR